MVPRSDDVVPIAMEVIAFDSQRTQLLRGHPLAGGVLAPVEASTDDEPTTIGGVGDQVDDRLVGAYGHPAGDYVLKRLAEVVVSNIRVEDLFARVGGEEFAIVLRDIPIDRAVECAERLREAVEKTVFRA